MHPDLPQEQAYFDRALALRDRQHAVLERAPGLTAHPKAVLELRRRVSGLGVVDPDEAVAFGRIDAGGQRWYIGKGAIWDDDNDLVVVNWQAPIAAPFYTATPRDPAGLDARRVYRCRGNQIQAIEEIVFRRMAEAIVDGREPEPVLSDALLNSLDRDRSGELAEIVATIQEAQYDVVSRDIDQLLVVQGGPGTGKTVVGLHRVSWLLFNLRDRLGPNDVLIVGPNPAFVRYISAVLPSLGDEAVVQLPLEALGPRVRIGRVDPPAVRRLKGDRRMLRLLERGVRQRQRVTTDDVELRVGGRPVALNGRRIATRARQLLGRPHNEAHRELRAFVIDEARRQLTRAGVRDLGAFEVTGRGESGREIDNYLARAWPQLTPQSFLVELLSSRQQLVSAALGTLRDTELEMLALPIDTRVGTWQWSVDDVPLLDAADALLNGRPASYEHIVVDEAQDLSPMQLESIRRRARAGSMTVLGDLAQATSPWAHESWDEVVEQLRHTGVAVETVELELGYRLPAEVHEVAMRLLPEVAPTLRCPRAVRRTGHDVMVTTTDAAGLAASTVGTIRELLGSGLIGVVCPAVLRAELARSLDADGLAWSPELRAATSPVVVLGADEVKGLEFDCVVVIEPALIVAEGEHGLRSLFVALTRCTSRLALVHAEPLPAVLGLAPEPPAVSSETLESAGSADHDEPDESVESGELADADQRDEPVESDDPAASDASDETAGTEGAAGADAPSEESDDAVVVALSVVDDHEPVGGVVVDLGPILSQAAMAVGDGEPHALDPIDAAIARDAFDGLEWQIAQAVAAVVAARIRATIRSEMLPTVTDELVRLLGPRAEPQRGG